MRTKATKLFKDALACALKGDEEETRGYLREYKDRILAVAREIDALRRDLSQLEDEHGAICTVYGANRK